MGSQAKEKGNKHFQAKEYKEAIECFTEAIGSNPDDHILYSNRSAAYAATLQYADALTDAQKCVSLNPNWPKGYSRLGTALYHLERKEEAKQAYSDGLKIDPTNSALLEGLQAVKESAYTPMEFDVAKFCERTAHLKEYMDKDPSYAKKLSSAFAEVSQDRSALGRVFKSYDAEVMDGLVYLIGESHGGHHPNPRANPPEKKETPKKQEPPKSDAEIEAENFKLEGNKHYKKREFDEALVAYDKAIAVCPTDITFTLNKTAVFLEMGQFDKAIVLCSELLKKRTELNVSFAQAAKIYNRMGAIYNRQEKYDEAIEMYEKALLEDNDRLTRNALRDVQRVRDKKKKEAYQSPELCEAHKQKGNELFKKGEYAAAKLEYDEAIARNEKDAKVWGNRAAVLTKLGEFPSALKDCEKAIELDPTFTKCHIRRGNLHFLMKENHKALQAFEEALRLDPQNVEAQQGKYKVYSKIRETNASNEVDEDAYRHAMADPEIQQILGDPQFQMILKKITENPSSLSQYMTDPKVSNGISKLISAGILRTA